MRVFSQIGQESSSISWFGFLFWCIYHGFKVEGNQSPHIGFYWQYIVITIILKMQAYFSGYIWENQSPTLCLSSHCHDPAFDLALVRHFYSNYITTLSHPNFLQSRLMLTRRKHRPSRWRIWNVKTFFNGISFMYWW